MIDWVSTRLHRLKWKIKSLIDPICSILLAILYAAALLLLASIIPLAFWIIWSTPINKGLLERENARKALESRLERLESRIEELESWASKRLLER